jgi:hypothetical protein
MKKYSVYEQPVNLLGCPCGTTHWTILTSPDTSTTEGLLTLQEAEIFCKDYNKNNPFPDYILRIKDRTVFDAIDCFPAPILMYGVTRNNNTVYINGDGASVYYNDKGEFLSYKYDWDYVSQFIEIQETNTLPDFFSQCKKCGGIKHISNILCICEVIEEQKKLLEKLEKKEKATYISMLRLDNTCIYTAAEFVARLADAYHREKVPVYTEEVNEDGEHEFSYYQEENSSFLRDISLLIFKNLKINLKEIKEIEKIYEGFKIKSNVEFKEEDGYLIAEIYKGITIHNYHPAFDYFIQKEKVEIKDKRILGHIHNIYLGNFFEAI